MKLHRTSVLASLGVVALGVFSTARAQDFNVDVGTTYGIPPATYGAGAAQPGVWNGLASLGRTGPYSDLALENTAGVTTAVAVSNVGGFGDAAQDNIGTAVGGDQELMDDYQDVSIPQFAPPTTWTFTGLANGSYEVYTYAWAPDSDLAFSNVSVAGTTSTNPQICGGPWPGVQTLGITYTRHSVVVTTGTISITIASRAFGPGTVNGFQLDQLPPATTAFCFGDGTGTQCPCPAQNGAPGNGCRHSQSASGANLTSTGSNDVSANNLTLTASLMPVGTFVIFRQGTVTLGDGLGVLSPDTDGLDCIGGMLVRIGRFMTVGGTASVTNIVGAGGIPPEGGTRHYQAIYRNANAAWCSRATLNGTNALTAVWVP